MPYAALAEGKRKALVPVSACESLHARPVGVYTSQAQWPHQLRSKAATLKTE